MISNSQHSHEKLSNSHGRIRSALFACRILASQRGSIIVFSVLMMTVVLTITLTLTRIFIPRIRAITEATDSIGAVYAADSAMEWCLYNNREKDPVLPQPVMANGSTYQIFSGGSPSACPGGEPINYRTVGTYRGVSRSFEVSEL